MSPTVHPPLLTAAEPPLLTDGHVYEQALTWLERARVLLDDTSAWTVEVQDAMQGMVQALVLCANGQHPTAVVATDEPPAPPAAGPHPEAVQSPRPPRPRPTPRAAPNGHPPAQEPRQWSLNERLLELGYPEEVSRSDRIKLGQAVVQAYRQTHGKAPAMAD
jgi:hypothetical protein